jgi:hypothetical protein
MEEDTRMTGLTIKAKRKRYPSDGRDGDQREKPKHMFRDIGPAVAHPDFRPRIYGDPDQARVLIFARVGRDYTGPWPAGRC